MTEGHADKADRQLLKLQLRLLLCLQCWQLQLQQWLWLSGWHLLISDVCPMEACIPFLLSTVESFGWKVLLPRFHMDVL